ncbi:hypothetical protein ACFL35_02870 [Candidatus Riflebacteria bacterium]
MNIMLPDFDNFSAADRKKYLHSIEKALPLCSPEEYYRNRKNLDEFSNRFPLDFKEYFFPKAADFDLKKLLQLREKNERKSLWSMLTKTEDGNILEFFDSVANSKLDEDNETGFFLITRKCRLFLLGKILYFLGKVEPVIEFSRVRPFLKHKDPRIVATVIEFFPTELTQQLHTFLNSPYPRIFAEAFKKIYPQQGPQALQILNDIEKKGPHFQEALKYLYQQMNSANTDSTQKDDIQSVSENNIIARGESVENIFHIFGRKNFNQEQYKELIECLVLLADMEEKQWDNYIRSHRNVFNNTFALKLRNFYSGNFTKVNLSLKKIINVLGGKVKELEEEKEVPKKPYSPSTSKKTVLSINDEIPFLPRWNVKIFGQNWDLMGLTIVVIINITFFIILLFILNN